MQHLGNVVDGRRVDGRHDGLLVDVAHEADLALEALADRPVRAAHQRVGLDADRAQCLHRVLGGLGLELARGPDVRDQRHVQEEAVVTADLGAHLPRGLQERQRLDVADGPAHLGDDEVDVGAAEREHPLLDLVGDVRDHLDGVAEVLAAPLLGDDRAVDLTGRHVVATGEVLVQEALVVTDVEVGLGAVVGDEDLAVLERVHRAGIDVEVRVELLHRDAQTARLEQPAQRAGGQPLAERGGDSTGDEQVAGTAGLAHATPRASERTGDPLHGRPL